MRDRSIKEIEWLLKSVTDPDDPFLTECRNDSRKGVQNLLDRWARAYGRKRKLEEKWRDMCSFEWKAREQGKTLIAGIDEVGRGPLAGPVVAAAVILPEGAKILGLDDSKKISERKREEYFEEIMEMAISVGVGIVHCDVIDDINIYNAAKRAMQEALSQLQPQPDHLLIDAMELPVKISQESIIKGDSRSVSISAASIIAKVTRDRLMTDYDRQYPQYGFKKNMGYGTEAHLKALRTWGPTPWHRRSFAPVRDVINNSSV
ncbi:MAG: ribonuclease HII [Bacillus sp. (in: firmicutes)]